MTGFYVFLGAAALGVIYLAFLAGRRDAEQRYEIKQQRAINQMAERSANVAKDVAV